MHEADTGLFEKAKVVPPPGAEEKAHY